MARVVPTTEPPEIGESIALEVGNPVAGGQCIARFDGRVVFVRDALPGEQVTATVTGYGKGGAFLRAEVNGVVVASPDRVVPPCPIASECGGCDWQHASLGEQRRIKAAVIIDALTRTGGITEILGQPLADVVVVREVVDQSDPANNGPTDDGLHWRTRMRYAINSSGQVGLRAARSHRIIPAADCPLAVSELRADVPGTIETQRDQKPPRALVAAHSNTGQTEMTLDERDRSLLTEQVRDREFQVGLTGFWQVHPAAPSLLVDHVLELANVDHGDQVLDLYSGVGLFAAFLGEAVGLTGRVDAVEGEKAAVMLARQNTRDVESVNHHCSRVDSWIARRGQRADVVVLDPPRAGAGSSVVADVVGLAPRTVVYVACDPVALARDAKTFANLGYALAELRSFDIFPMTKHVESIAIFRHSH
ncbi:MAG: class I SAM-dependent RNA methyltransferase [Actinobacteria bacterium]|nr:class I SAM-dependent RNA methyltransferase [Actinomycetota bacterium]